MAKKDELTEAQKSVLLNGDPDFFSHDRVYGHGATLMALRRKGLIEGIRLTDLGAQVVKTLHG